MRLGDWLGNASGGRRLLRATAPSLLALLAALSPAGCHRAGPASPPARAGDAGAAATPRPDGAGVGDPALLDAGGTPLAWEGPGYALLYPFVGDLDGDGRPDLLLGDRDRGRLRVYRNLAPAGAPRLAAPAWFDEAVPTGKVPDG